MSVPVLELEGTSVGYDERAVVREVSLRVDRGEVVVLLGPNGSGKTTLVRGVLGLATVLGGRMRLFGTPSGEFRDRARIGYVPQRHTIASGVPSTVREVVASGRLARRRLWQRAGSDDRAAVEAAITDVGLADRTGTPVAQLSGGQQRRVLIARALAAEPELLVMDEPTAGVDSSHQRALADVVAVLAARGVTVLQVAHEIGPMAPVITRAVVMHEGRVVHDGPPAEVMPRWASLEPEHHHHLDEHHDDHRGDPATPRLLGDTAVGG